MNNPLDLFAWKVRSERKRQHLTQKQLAERLGMNPRTIIDLETCQSNPKFETVVLVAKELKYQRGRRHLPGNGKSDSLENSCGLLCREKRSRDRKIYRALQTGGSLSERRVTRSGSMCPAALLFHPFAMRAVYYSFVL